ncbi:MAG: carboxypeptidase M32 [Phycisphaerales bacterium]|nr:carboxypeptidase M32 [Phycisphaerales bacterium]
MSDAYAKLLDKLRDIGKLDALDALLEWDQDVMMPPKGITAHAECVAFVASERHKLRTSPEMGELLEQLNDADNDPVRATNVREARRKYKRAVKVPAELISEIARTASKGRDIWAAARKANDYAKFSPTLGKLIKLKREQAQAIGFKEHPYDALMDEYEPGATTKDVGVVFDELRRQLVPLVRALADAPNQPDVSILHRSYPRPGQEKLCRKLAEDLGFDFDAGRLDVTVHPFCTSIGGGGDVRVTTRYDEQFFPPAIFGLMHEVGHGLYEQGLEPEHVFTPMGMYCSLGIHESQSRLWENMVGRSKAFWQTRYALAQEMLGASLAGVSLDAFHAAINHVAPSLIRVEADEVTYGLHIILRFEMERDILSGKLEVDDVPEAWNAKMTELVGVTPPNDAQGCMQDVHWSMGAFGYFPTYALGNLYAAQFLAAAKRDIPDLVDRIAAGDTRTLLDWLRRNVHRHGMRYQANELCREATGESLSVAPFMQYLETKFKPIYGLA